MALLVDGSIIMKAVQAATCIDFEQDEAAKDKLRLPARMKGCGVKRLQDVRYPASCGTIMDIMPRCIDRKEDNGTIERGFYSEKLRTLIGKGVYDAARHRNRKFMESTEVGPYPSSMQWSCMGTSKRRRCAKLRVNLIINASRLEQARTIKQSHTSRYEEHRSSGQKAHAYRIGGATSQSCNEGLIAWDGGDHTRQTRHT